MAPPEKDPILGQNVVYAVYDPQSVSVLGAVAREVIAVNVVRGMNWLAEPSSSAVAPSKVNLGDCSTAPSSAKLISIWITGSTSAPGQGCELRAFATTRACRHGMSVRIWVRGRLGAFACRNSESLQRVAES